jgi:SAM-dependent methyltransferase
VADRVHVIASVPLDELLGCTADADVGVSLLQDSCENHRLALPNKLFEYIAAGVPVLTSALPEMRRLVDDHGIGWTVRPDDAGDVRRGLAEALAARGDGDLRERVRVADRELSWERERERLLGLYRRLEGAEQDRLRDVYATYGASPGRQRRWSASNAGNALIREQLLDRVLELTGTQRAAGAQVLDIGCGRGWWLGRLADSGVDPVLLHGVDLIADRVDATARRVPGATVLHADAAGLPFEDARFGVVLMFTTLSSAVARGRRERALAEARRVLAPGGLLLVYEPRLPNPRNRHTRRVPRGELDRVPGASVVHESLTLLPALARAAGRRGRSLHALPALHTHRLSIITAES